MEDTTIKDMMHNHGESMHQIGIEIGLIRGRQQLIDAFHAARDSGELSEDAYYAAMKVIVGTL